MKSLLRSFPVERILFSSYEKIKMMNYNQKFTSKTVINSVLMIPAGNRIMY